MQEVLQNPRSASILEQYNKHISALNILTQAFIKASNLKWDEIYEEYNNPDIMKRTKVAEISDGVDIFDVNFELGETNEATYWILDKLLACMKKIDPRYRDAKTIEDFNDIDDKIHSMQSNTENKLLDEKIKKALYNFFVSLSDEEKIIFNDYYTAFIK